MSDEKENTEDKAERKKVISLELVIWVIVLLIIVLVAISSK